MTQTDLVLDHLKEHGHISPREAMDFGCYRLAARIMDLRNLGIPIKTENEKHEGGTHARYYLAH